jgi:hypothetical protein
MTHYLTTQQHQMLEDLTGLQHTKTGKVRAKQNRSESESKRLGIVTPAERSWQHTMAQHGFFNKGKK